MRFTNNTILPALLISIVLGQAPLLNAQEETLNAQEETQWERVPLKTTLNLWDVSFADSLTGVAVGDYGVILRTVDGGDSWKQTLSEEQFALRRIHFFNDSVAIAAGFRGSLIRSTNAGESWSIIRLDTEANLSSMASIGETAWVGGTDGAIYKTTDNGATWKPKTTGRTNVISALSFADEQHGFCASRQGLTLRSSDGGESWIEMEVPSQFPVTAILAVSADTILLTDYNRTLLKSTNGGESWIRLNAYQNLYHSIAIDNNGSGWAVGKGGVIVHEQPFAYDEQLAVGETRWTQVYRSHAPWINAICFLGNGKAFAVGHNGTVLRCTTCNTGKAATSPTE